MYSISQNSICKAKIATLTTIRTCHLISNLEEACQLAEANSTGQNYDEHFRVLYRNVG